MRNLLCAGFSNCAARSRGCTVDFAIAKSAVQQVFELCSRFSNCAAGGANFLCSCVSRLHSRFRRAPHVQKQLHQSDQTDSNCARANPIVQRVFQLQSRFQYTWWHSAGMHLEIPRHSRFQKSKKPLYSSNHPHTVRITPTQQIWVSSAV